jgi:DNA-directed RNA polymerase subunit RPC12/RpoP
MGVVTLTCPYCGSPDIHCLPNEELRTTVITPYHCNGCHHTFESGPFQLAQKAHPSDPKPKRDGD